MRDLAFVLFDGVIAELWSKPYRQEQDFFVELMTQQCRGLHDREEAVSAPKSTLRWELWLLAPQPLRACRVNRIGRVRTIELIFPFRLSRKHPIRIPPRPSHAIAPLLAVLGLTITNGRAQINYPFLEQYSLEALSKPLQTLTVK